MVENIQRRLEKKNKNTTNKREAKRTKESQEGNPKNLWETPHK